MTAPPAAPMAIPGPKSSRSPELAIPAPAPPPTIAPVMAPSTSPSRFFCGMAQPLPSPVRARIQRAQNPNPRFILLLLPWFWLYMRPRTEPFFERIVSNRIRSKKQTQSVPGLHARSLDEASGFLRVVLFKCWHDLGLEQGHVFDRLFMGGISRSRPSNDVTKAAEKVIVGNQ